MMPPPVLWFWLASMGTSARPRLPLFTSEQCMVMMRRAGATSFRELRHLR